ncbi:helix-turn-helix transcriptional regulator [Listeria monocytogenes]|uniref:helix-turn-helix domain-containing protein n=1 Tax=Listeria monocytogenes TaxID=1639 RepID=UPI002FDBF8F5
MITVYNIKTALADRNLQAVARATGINAATLYRLVQGKTKPNQATLKLIAAYLAQA